MFDFAGNLFFKKVSGQVKHGSESDEIIEKKILNDVYFFLCGLNTESLRYEEETGVFLAIGYTNSVVLKEIQKMNNHTRRFERFIYENEYSDDTLRRIFSSQLEKLIYDFYEYIVGIRKKISSIEEFIVSISFYIEIFDEIENILQIFVETKGDAIINVIKERMDKMVQFEFFYSELIEKFAFDINQRIAEFVYEGTITSQFFMIRERTVFEFKEKFLRDKFQMNSPYVPFYIDDPRDILESGLYTVLMKELKTSTTLDHEISEIPSDLFMHNKNKEFLRLIKEQKEHKYQIINRFFQQRLEQELDTLKKHVFLLDQSFISDIFADIQDEIYKFNTKNIQKVNRTVNCVKMKYSISKVNFVTVMSKILNIEENYNLDENLNIIEGLTVRYCPEGPIKMLFSQKNIHELELIFRMLYTIQIINYCSLKKQKSQFHNILLILNNTLLSTFYSNKIFTEAQNIPTNDVNMFMTGTEGLIKTSLRDLYLTSYPVFKILSKYFHLCFKYIKYDKEDLDSLKNIIHELSSEIDHENHNLFLANLLFSIKNAL